MKKKTSSSARSQASDSHLFAKPENRRRRSLFLARFLSEEARANLLRGKKQDHAQEILRNFAGMESKGHLDKKETALDASFLHEVFGEALGYQSVTQSPENYQLERNSPFPESGQQTALWACLARKTDRRPLRSSNSKGPKSISTATSRMAEPPSNSVGITSMRCRIVLGESSATSPPLDFTTAIRHRWPIRSFI